MCPFWNVIYTESATFGLCSFWNVTKMECALFGMCFFEMCSFWNVFLIECDKKCTLVKIDSNTIFNLADFRPF